MKRVLVFLAPLLIAIAIFFGILFLFDRKTGKGALHVTSIPQSKVYLGDKLIGTTPFCACDLAQMVDVGNYAIKLIPLSGNFNPFEERITINKSTLTAVDKTFADNGEGEGNIIELMPLNNKKDVEVLIVSMPDKANVFLDGNPVGITPLLLRQVSESDHDLRLTRDGYKDKSIKIRTALGFKLSSLIFLGVKADLSSFVASISATPSSAIAVSKVLILNTPTEYLNVRESNSVASNKIAQIKPGESYELIEEQEGWFKIKLVDGKEGWISSKYAIKE
ncbi:MAG: PEGA domain-containing protein, partial [Candidatus Levybacteria bacterium]|nr:PEGA domain-containing protein [Candidatus Levybacteria bacterium]MDZ4227949.1 PEGA domain-containing protein [Candidatus Levybacteria bacterium]